MAEPTDPLTPDAAAAPKKSKGVLRLLLLLLPMVLLPASAGAYLAYDFYPRLAHVAAAVGLKHGLEDPDDDPAPKPMEFGQFKVLSDLLVNPAGTNGKRFLMVSLGLESSTEKVFAEIDSKDAVVRDIILRKLGERTVDDLSAVASREVLKEDLRQTINSVLQQGQIDRLYFTQFVLQ